MVEPNFNERLQAMAARALLLARQREQAAAAQQGPMREAPTMYERRASAARANPALQARQAQDLQDAQARGAIGSLPSRDNPSPRSFPTSAQQLEPKRTSVFSPPVMYANSGPHNPAAAYISGHTWSGPRGTYRQFPDQQLMNQGFREMYEDPYVQAANMLLQSAEAENPVAVDPTTWFNREQDMQMPIGFSPDWVDVQDPRGPAAKIIYDGPRQEQLQALRDSLRRMPISQGPPPEGYSGSDAAKKHAAQRKRKR